MTEKERLKVVAETFKAIISHAQEGGSFRYLIYERLGFSVESGAYATLWSAGGGTISNEFELTNNSKEMNKTHKEL